MLKSKRQLNGVLWLSLYSRQSTRQTCIWAIRGHTALKNDIVKCIGGLLKMLFIEGVWQ